MDVISFIERIRNLEIEYITGVPDSTLKNFCFYLSYQKDDNIKHLVAANEGAAVGIAAGVYLSTGKPACIYMQNSGMGNAVNPIVSLLNEKVYAIPALFIIGWRGQPGIKDEPQHIFQGEITRDLCNVMNISHGIIGKDTTEGELDAIFHEAKESLDAGKQYAVIIKQDTFDNINCKKNVNKYTLVREEAIAEIIRNSKDDDVIVSTTGKISREVYTQCDNIKKNHKQSFLTVGSMGHASMIALGIALNKKNKTVICIDGDGAALMHMGALPTIAKQNPRNMIHVVLYNDAHESVGGMDTCAPGLSIAEIAKASGYKETYYVEDLDSLRSAFKKAYLSQNVAMIEVKVSLFSRKDLIRPKESAIENKENFIMFHEFY